MYGVECVEHMTVFFCHVVKVRKRVYIDSLVYKHVAKI